VVVVLSVVTVVSRLKIVSELGHAELDVLNAGQAVEGVVGVEVLSPPAYSEGVFSPK
jgi:hypothetical protein